MIISSSHHIITSLHFITSLHISHHRITSHLTSSLHHSTHITSHTHPLQFNNVENEFITFSSISSSHDVIVATSITGGIHINARRPDWKVLFPSLPHSQLNTTSKPYPRPVVHQSTSIPLEAGGFGGYQPITLPSISSVDKANIDLLRLSSFDSFPDSSIDTPRMRCTLNPALLEPSTQPRIRHIIKLKKRITPNSILFGQQQGMLVDVDPRKQHLKWSERNELSSEEKENSIPTELRFKEMKLNHYGFYDIDYASYNKWAFRWAFHG